MDKFYFPVIRLSAILGPTLAVNVMSNIKFSTTI